MDMSSMEEDQVVHVAVQVVGDNGALSIMMELLEIVELHLQ
jgi:hypothetical protein